MTANQISYAKLVEERRHNEATESENFRHDLEAERISSAEQVASMEHFQRQDAINEEHYARMDSETARANLRGEELKFREQNIRGRELDVKQQEANTAWLQAKVQESKVANDYEIGMIEARASADQATAALINAGTNAEKLLIEQQNADSKSKEVELYGEEVEIKNKQLGINILNTMITAQDVRNRGVYEYNQSVHMRNQDIIAAGNLSVATSKAKSEIFRNVMQGKVAQAQTTKTEAETGKVKAETGKIEADTKVSNTQARKNASEAEKIQSESELRKKDIEWYDAKQMQGIIGTGVDVVNAVVKAVGLVGILG